MKNKKKIKPVSRFKVLIKGIVALLGLAGCCFGIIAGIFTGSFAQMSIVPMRYTNLPADSEFISFEMGKGGSGTYLLAYGYLYFASELPEESLLEFFDMRTFQSCRVGIEPPIYGLTLENHDEEGRNIYRLCRYSVYD